LELFEKYKNEEEKLIEADYEEILFEIKWKRRTESELSAEINVLFKDVSFFL